MANDTREEGFPCELIIDIPFPSQRLAEAAVRTLSVDQELSPLVQRDLLLASPSQAGPSITSGDPAQVNLINNVVHTKPPNSVPQSEQIATPDASSTDDARTVLRSIYRATTNRMLRVAVNGFFESLRVVLQVIEELDVDVIHAKGLEGLERVQGVEQGLIGETVTGS